MSTSPQTKEVDVACFIRIALVDYLKLFVLSFSLIGQVDSLEG